ncbi:MAG TPA: DUF433 domain-containing protein [Phenylobacterium sp.]
MARFGARFGHVPYVVKIPGEGDGEAALMYAFVMYELLQRITIERDKMGGKPCIRGLRVRVQDVLEMLAGGATADQILADFPYLEPEDIRAVLAYAAVQVAGTTVIAA